MIHTNKTDKETVAHILTESFDQNKSANWAIKKGENRKKRLNALMRYAFDVCSDVNGAFLSEDKKAALLFDLPLSKNKNKVLTTYYDIQLIFNAVGPTRVMRLLKREAYIKEKHPVTDFIYLWFVGVLPGYQKKGYGSAMLENLIVISEQKNMPIYLETSMPENLPFYKKYDFEIYHEWKSEYADFPVWFLKRDI